MAKILSAGVVPVRQEGGSWRFLLLRVYKYWDFPKGIVEPGEDPWRGALRELAEETGIRDARPLKGGEFYETEPYSGGKVARYYLAEVETDEVRIERNPSHGKYEHHESRWVVADEGLKLLVPRVQNVLNWADRLLRKGL